MSIGTVSEGIGGGHGGERLVCRIVSRRSLFQNLCRLTRRSTRTPTAGIQPAGGRRLACFVRRHKLRAPLAVAILTAVGLPLLAYAAFPPARRLLPTLAGVQCVGEICTDRPEQRHEAEQLYSEAVQFVHEKLGTIDNPPQIIFCQLNSCASYFGLRKSKAQTTGPFGTVIGPDGWLPYIVRHELIHQLQNERLGRYRMHPGPDWFIEGMAYSMSDDPRSDLGQPWQENRDHFNNWYAALNNDQLWVEAVKLQ